MLIGRPAARGFTLIELAITLAVAGVLTALGLPIFTTWINNTKIRTAAEGMLNGIQIARSEAVRQNLNVQIVFVNQSDWTVSAISGGALVPVQSRAGKEGSSNATVAIIPGGADTLTFNSLARVTTNGDGSPSITQIQVGSAAGGADIRNMRITVGAGGNVRLCDPQVAAPDPRGC